MVNTAPAAASSSSTNPILPTGAATVAKLVKKKQSDQLLGASKKLVAQSKQGVIPSESAFFSHHDFVKVEGESQSSNSEFEDEDFQHSDPSSENAAVEAYPNYQAVLSTLELNNLVIPPNDRIPKDGNCFPACIAARSIEMNGHLDARKKIVKFLREHGDKKVFGEDSSDARTFRDIGPDFGPRLDDGDWKLWLARMATNREWMEGACIYAAAYLIHSEIVLITNDANEAHRVLIIRPALHENADHINLPVTLVYFVNLHFTVPFHRVDVTGEGMVSVNPFRKNTQSGAGHSSSSSTTVEGKGARIIAMYNYKGGVAKTTNTINIGSAIAMQGKRVLLIDADPQCNLTNFFYYDTQKYATVKKEEEDAALPNMSEDVEPTDLEETAEDDKEFINERMAAQIKLDDQQQQVLRMIARNLNTVNPQSPLSFDRPNPKQSQKLSDLVSGSSHPLKPFHQPCLYDIMSHVINNYPSGIDESKLRVQQVSISESLCQELKLPVNELPLYLLPSNTDVIRLEATFTHASSDIMRADPQNMRQSIQKLYAFRTMIDLLTTKYNIDVVLVDLSPSASILNEEVVMCCDYVVPPTFSDRFSLSSASGFLHYIFPQWMKRADQRRDAIKKFLKDRPNSEELNSKDTAVIPRSRPFILPLIVTNFTCARPELETTAWQKYREKKTWLEHLQETEIGEWKSEDIRIRKLCATRRKEQDPAEYEKRSSVIAGGASNWMYQLEHVVLSAPNETKNRYLPLNGMMLIPLVKNLFSLVHHSHNVKVPAIMFTYSLFELVTPGAPKQALAREVLKVDALRERLNGFATQLLALPIRSELENMLTPSRSAAAPAASAGSASAGSASANPIAIPEAVPLNICTVRQASQQVLDNLELKYRIIDDELKQRFEEVRGPAVEPFNPRALQWTSVNEPRKKQKYFYLHTIKGESDQPRNDREEKCPDNIEGDEVESAMNDDIPTDDDAASESQATVSVRGSSARHGRMLTKVLNANNKRSREDGEEHED